MLTFLGQRNLKMSAFLETVTQQALLAKLTLTLNYTHLAHEGILSCHHSPRAATYIVFASAKLSVATFGIDRPTLTCPPRGRLLLGAGDSHLLRYRALVDPMT